MTTPFPSTRLTKDDAYRLVVHLGHPRTNLQSVKQWLATNPPTEDVRKMVLLDIARSKLSPNPMAALHRGVLDLLVKRIQQNEKSEWLTAIETSLKKP